MKITARGKYAIKLMVDLAIYYNGEPVKLKDVARRQNISVKFLEQIISLLSRAGLIRSIRGANGGYMLTREPSKYTVEEILRITEGNLSIVDNTSPGEGYIDAEISVTSLIWEKLDYAIVNTLQGITLEDLKQWQENLGADQYVI